MLIKTGKSIPESQVTDERLYRSRREFIKGSAKLSLMATAGGLLACSNDAQSNADAIEAENIIHPAVPAQDQDNSLLVQKIRAATPSKFSTSEPKTPFEDVTRYNNFYEFGTGKDDPVRYAGALQTKPWSVAIDGEVEKPGVYDLEDILRPQDLEERIYRLRCVEAWSMVVPWVGFSLGDLIKRFKPTSRAKYVEFETLVDPRQMIGQRSRTSYIEWPYREGLRIDEAMHPLALLAVGLYGITMPPQNGAPIRLVVPWKYGFKSIKSIVRINFRETQPKTTWSQLSPREYGFFANVNPSVDHPRWSQKTERRLPSSLFSPNRIETQPFNGYAEEVASLYAGMDLAKFY